MRKCQRMLVLTFTAAMLALLFIVSAGARASSDEFDAAAVYKTKCVACHGPKAEKKFDATKSDEEHIQIILKGKKLEKPPNMPGLPGLPGLGGKFPGLPGGLPPGLGKKK